MWCGDSAWGGYLCFIADTDISEISATLTALKTEILEGGIVERTGAVGPIRPVYFRDPDGNLLAVSNYI